MEYSASNSPLTIEQKLDLFTNILRGMYTTVDLSYSNFNTDDALYLSHILSSLSVRPTIVIHGNPIYLPGVIALNTTGVPLNNMGSCDYAVLNEDGSVGWTDQPHFVTPYQFWPLGMTLESYAQLTLNDIRSLVQECYSQKLTTLKESASFYTELPESAATIQAEILGMTEDQSYNSLGL